MTERILVVGCGIAGMCTALALAKDNADVTIIERDDSPPEGDADQAFFQWPRRGATQFRHPHAFLGLMCNLLEERYPDLLEAFYAAGARRVEYKDMLPAELERKYTARPGDDKLWVLMCRRATIETVLRRYVGEQSSICIVNDLTIDGILVDHEGEIPAVRGVKVRRDCVAAHGETILADVVVDATGRTTRFPRWLNDEGISVRTEDYDAEIVYYTRHYQLREGEAEPPRNARDRAAGDLGYIKFGVFPADNGHFAVIVCLHECETELRKTIKTGEGFDAVCRNIPGLQPWLAPEKSVATTQPFGIGDIRSIWRHYVDTEGEKEAGDANVAALNFFAVGDAMVRTNPLYGRGCSTSILHAHLLAEALRESDDPLTRAKKFAERSDDQLRPIFDASRREDENGVRRAVAANEGQLLEANPKGLKKRFGVAFGDAIAAASRFNLHVNRGVMRTVNLLEKPGDFLKDRRTQAIVLAYMLRGRGKNAVARMQRGPTRTEMLAEVADSVG